MLLKALVDTFRLLRDPGFRRLGWLSLTLSLALLVAALAIAMLLSESLITADAPLPYDPDRPFGAGGAGLMDLIGVTGIFVLLITSMGLMVPVAAVFGALSMNEIALRVERLRWSWPAQAGARRTVKDSVNFTGLLIAANVVTVVLMVFLIGLFGPWVLFLWYGMNGWLLGREYFALTARRHLDPEALRQLRQADSGQIWLAGSVMAFFLSLPLINLATPFVGAAWFTFLFHRMRAG